MINDDNKKSIKKMLKSSGLYFALGLCLLAAGLIGLSAVDEKTPEISGNNIPEIIETQNNSEKQTQTPENYKVEINIDEFTTVKQEEPSTAAVFDNNAQKVEENTTKAEEKQVFYSPLSLSIGADYSMGVPVFSQTMKDYRTHNGVDFKGVRGENVKAVADGVVVSVKKDAVWGNTVSIEHKNSIVSTVSGLSDEALISTGTEVYAGTVIGVIGEIPIESEDEPHVHLEMRVNGKLTDPLEILGLSGEE